MVGKESEVEPDVHVIHFARHEPAGPSERQEGRKWGRIIDRGYRVRTREGDTFEISTLNWESGPEDIDAEVSKVKEIIEDRLGRRELNIKIS